MNNINLLETTFIIPIKVEHPDRLRNAKNVLGFLNRYLKTNVFIYEITDSGKSELDFLSGLSNLNIKHWISSTDFLDNNLDFPIFHRTKYLNTMLDEVNTPVVCNYDIDVLIRPIFYEFCQETILKGESDVVYPFKFGNNGQIRILDGFNYQKFSDSNFDLDVLDMDPNINHYSSEYGHCIFFNTEIYKKFGAENEDFISYGPEDKERGERFKKMGFNVRWIEESIVYHFEHYRGSDSGGSNPYFSKNWEVYNGLEKLGSNETKEYYKSISYYEKYKTIGK